MTIHARADDPALVLHQRFEALASQLEDLEKLRDRVAREEDRKLEARRRQSSYQRNAVAKGSNYFNESAKAIGAREFNRP